MPAPSRRVSGVLALTLKRPEALHALATPLLSHIAAFLAERPPFFRVNSHVRDHPVQD